MKLTEGDTIAGPAGSATKVLMEREPSDRPDWLATLGSWFLDCPGQSPAWSHYLLSIIHLRPIPDVKPAVVRFPHATHEVMLIALDPSADPSPTNQESWRFLQPINLMEQVQLDDDDQALVLIDEAAQATVNGITWAEPPLSGQVEPWLSILVRTSAHLRGEEHAG